MRLPGCRFISVRRFGRASRYAFAIRRGARPRLRFGRVLRALTVSPQAIAKRIAPSADPIDHGVIAVAWRTTLAQSVLRIAACLVEGVSVGPLA
jgi:hypothetical protein